MKNACLALVLAFAGVVGIACGDDDSQAANTGDGGVPPEDLAQLNDRIDEQNEAIDEVAVDVSGLRDDHEKLEQDVRALSDEVEGLGTGPRDAGVVIDDLSDAVDELDDRVTELETPPACEDGVSCAKDRFALIWDAFEPIITARCAHWFACCDSDELNVAVGPNIDSEDECVQVAHERLLRGLSPLLVFSSPESHAPWLARTSDPADPAYVFDSDAIAACAESIEAESCVLDDATANADRCDDYDHAFDDDPCAIRLIARGTRGLGEHCNRFEPNQCVEGALCFNGPGSDPNSVCVPLAVEGDACNEDTECDLPSELMGLDRDLFCNVTTGQCEQRHGEGEPCAYAVQDRFTMFGGDPGSFTLWLPVQTGSDVSVECAASLLCDPLSLTCVSYCSEGAPCETYQPACEAGLVCNQTIRHSGLSDLGTCREPSANGEPCVSFEECASGRCAYDDGDERDECQAKLAAAGEDCALDDAGVGQDQPSCESGYCKGDGSCASSCDDAACPEGESCIDTSQGLRCETPVADGDPCVSAAGTGDLDRGCATGYCDDGSGTCALKVALGGSCDSGRDPQCPDSQYCSADTCVDRVDEGNHCTDDHECGLDAYCGSQGANEAACTPYVGAVGGACDVLIDDYRCAETLTCVAVGLVTECQVSGQYPAGTSCSEDTECGSGWCARGLCTDILAEGDACDLVLGLTRCADGLFCQYELDRAAASYGQGECAEQGTAGQLCDYRYESDYDLGPVSPCRGYCHQTDGIYMCGAESLPEGADQLCDGD